MWLKVVSFACAVLVASSLGVSAAGAAVPSTASNMGLCSSYLAQLEVPGEGNVRAEVNLVIRDYGSFLGLASPGDLYHVRAHQHVNAPAPDECTPRQLPGGGQG